MNNVIENRKPRQLNYCCKWIYVKKYVTFLDIYPFTTIIQLKESIGGIHNCVTVVGKLIFDSDFNFAIPLTCDKLYFCCNNDNKKSNK